MHVAVDQAAKPDESADVVPLRPTGTLQPPAAPTAADDRVPAMKQPVVGNKAGSLGRLAGG